MVISLILLLTLTLLHWLLNKGRRSSAHQKLPPGPIGLPVVGYLPFLGPEPAVKIRELSKKYGDVFSMKLGQQLVLFVNDVETMREMGKMDNFLGRNQLEVIRAHRQNCGLIFLEREGWTEWRRFTIKSLKDMGYGGIAMEQLILDQVQDVQNFLRRNQRKPLSLQEFIEIPVLNALWIILTGEKYDLEDPEKKEILKTINEGVGDQAVMGILVFLPWLAKLFPDSTGWTKAVKCLGAPVDMVRSIVKSHERNYSPGYESDFIDLALTKIYSTASPTSSKFHGDVGIENLVFTILDLFFTGSDTVSTSLGWAFLILAAHPQAQRRIQGEIDQVIGSFQLPAVTDRTKMVYTEAVMMEIQRLGPMSPLGIMHTTLEDVDFRSFHIPERTVILWNMYHVHHDPAYWGDPHTFRPERFINPNDGTLRKDDHFIPFFVGKRSCPGESLAMNEYFLFLTGILQKFHVTLEDQGVDLDFRPRSPFICRPPRHRVVFVEREPNDTV